MTTDNLSPLKSARLVKSILTAAYPEIKFSVTSTHGYVNVRWEDGVTDADVEETLLKSDARCIAVNTYRKVSNRLWMRACAIVCNFLEVPCPEDDPASITAYSKIVKYRGYGLIYTVNELLLSYRADGTVGKLGMGSSWVELAHRQWDREVEAAYAEDARLNFNALMKEQRALRAEAEERANSVEGITAAIKSLQQELNWANERLADLDNAGVNADGWSASTLEAWANERTQVIMERRALEARKRELMEKRQDRAMAETQSGEDVPHVEAMIASFEQEHDPAPRGWEEVHAARIANARIIYERPDGQVLEAREGKWVEFDATAHNGVPVPPADPVRAFIRALDLAEMESSDMYNTLRDLVEMVKQEDKNAS